MSTISRGQRIGIWIVALAMALATIVMIALMIQPADSKTSPQKIMQDQALENQQKAIEKAKAEYEADRKNMQALAGYENQVKPFDANDVKQLTTETLTEGDGATVVKGDKIKVEYTLWNAEGTIMDSSTRKDGGASSVEFTLSSDNLIAGWVEGLDGKKVGGVYLLNVPADKAYGDEQGPLKFIVKINSIEK